MVKRNYMNHHKDSVKCLDRQRVLNIMTHQESLIQDTSEFIQVPDPIIETNLLKCSECDLDVLSTNMSKHLTSTICKTRRSHKMIKCDKCDLSMKAFYKNRHINSVCCSRRINANIQRELLIVLKKTLDTNEIIKEYPNMVVASNETGISHTQISDCVNNKRPSAGGFKWIKKTELRNTINGTC